MEASVAATDGAPDGAQGTQETATPAGLDLSPVMGRFDELAPRMERMEQLVSQLAGGEDDDDGDAGFDFDSLYGDPAEDPEAAAAARMNPEALQALMDQRVQQKMDELVNPLAQQVRKLQVGLDAEQLVARYPGLADPKVSGPVVQRAQQLAEAAGVPELADNMEFIETIYKAQMADKYAAGEVPVGAEQGFELERAGGAGPQSQEAQPDIAQRIVAARKAEQPWSAWA